MRSRGGHPLPTYRDAATRLNQGPINPFGCYPLVPFPLLKRGRCRDGHARRRPGKYRCHREQQSCQTPLKILFNEVHSSNQNIVWGQVVKHGLPCVGSSPCWRLWVSDGVRDPQTILYSTWQAASQLHSQNIWEVSWYPSWRWMLPCGGHWSHASHLRPIHTYMFSH